jgi:7 transmembrane sweet-taste receptor of 3 GCPR/Receptor family ligand binding region
LGGGWRDQDCSEITEIQIFALFVLVRGKTFHRHRPLGDPSFNHRREAFTDCVTAGGDWNFFAFNRCLAAFIMSSGGSSSSGSSAPPGRPILTSLPFYDNLRIQNATSFVREENNNLDVLVSNGTDDGNAEYGDRILAVCHLSFVEPFYVPGDGGPSRNGYESAAAVALAAHHLNVGDGSVVPELEGLNERCKVRFTTEFFDCGSSSGTAVLEVSEQISRRGLNAGGRPRPGAFLGNGWSSISIPTSIVTGLHGFVQVSSGSTSADLDDKDLFPLFARTVPSDHGTAIPIIRYFWDVLNVRYLVVINTNDSFGNAFAEGLRLASEAHAPGMKIVQLPLDHESNAMGDVVTRLKESEYRYIFALVFTRAVHDDLLQEAYRQGVAGTGVHNWFFPDSFYDVSLEGRVVEKGSPLHLAYKGTGAITYSGGIPGISRYDNFVNKMGELRNNQDLDYLKTVLPKFEGETPFLFEDDFLNTIDINPPFAYEAAVLVGLSACEAANAGLELTGREHYDRLVQTRFTGVMEDVVLIPDTGSRNPNATFFTVTNYVEQDAAADGDFVQFRGTVTDWYRDGQWTNIKAYILNDGTSNVPPDLPPVVVDMNYYSTGIRALVAAYCGIAILLSIGFASWTYAKRMTRVIRASQPFFLYLICVGTTILALSMIPLSLDHGVASVEGCTVACNAVVWLIALGSTIIFSALFTKTHRINKILRSSRRFRRIKVETRDVVMPMIVFLGGES